LRHLNRLTRDRFCTGDEAHVWQLLKTGIKDKDLRNILNRALQQDSSKRYHNMDSFAEDLTAWLAQKPVQATPDSWVYRIKKFSQRRRALFATLSTLLVMTLVGVALLSWQFRKTQVEANKANQVKDFMLGVFSAVDPDEAQGEKILAKDLLVQAFVEIQEQEFTDEKTKNDLLVSMGQAQLQLGLNQAADNSFATALLSDPNLLVAQLGTIKIEIDRGEYTTAKEQLLHLKKRVIEDDALHAEWLMLYARVLTDMDKDYTTAADLIVEAKNVFSVDNNFKGYYMAVRDFANIKFLQSESKAAASYLEQELKQAVTKLPITNTVVMGMRRDLVELYNDISDYDKAVKHNSELIEDVSRVLGDQHPFLIEAFIVQSGTQRATGEFIQAKESANKALSLSKKLNGEQHEFTARAMNFIGVLYFDEGKYEQALIYIRQAVSIYEQILGNDSTETWEIKTNLTAMLNLLHRFDEAITLLEPVYQKQVEVLGMSHKATIYTQSILTRLYVEVERLDEAQIIGSQMLESAIVELGMDHMLTVGAHFSVAKFYHKKNDYLKAIELMEAVIQHESWNESSPLSTRAYDTLADFYYDAGDEINASQYKEKSLAAAISVMTVDSPKTWEQMLRNLGFYVRIQNSVKVTELIDQIELIFNEKEEVSEALLERYEQLKRETNY